MSPISSVSHAALESGLDVLRSERSVLLIPSVFPLLRVYEQDVANGGEIATHVAVAVCPLPRDLVEKPQRCEDRVHQHLEVVARGRIAMEVDRSRRRRRPGRRGLCHPGPVRGAGAAGRGVGHPPPGERRAGASHRGPAHPPPRPTEPCTVGPLSQLLVSGGFLGPATAGDRQDRASPRPRVGFIVTTLTGTNRAVVRFYNQRGTAEQWIKEGKAATHWTRLSCHRFRANEVRLLLGGIAYNLGQPPAPSRPAARHPELVTDEPPKRLFKTGGRLIRHARYFILQLAESHLTSILFGQILRRIERLPWHPT
jgi:hypothetical protein